MSSKRVILSTLYYPSRLFRNIVHSASAAANPSQICSFRGKNAHVTRKEITVETGLIGKPSKSWHVLNPFAAKSWSPQVKNPVSIAVNDCEHAPRIGGFRMKPFQCHIRGMSWAANVIMVKQATGWYHNFSLRLRGSSGGNKLVTASLFRFMSTDSYDNQPSNEPTAKDEQAESTRVAVIQKTDLDSPDVKDYLTWKSFGQAITRPFRLFAALVFTLIRLFIAIIHFILLLLILLLQAIVIALALIVSFGHVLPDVRTKEDSDLDGIEIPLVHNYNVHLASPRWLLALQNLHETASSITHERVYTSQDAHDGIPRYTALIVGPRGERTYIIGTAHYSAESERDVRQLIQTVQPDVVALELCVSRRHLLESELTHKIAPVDYENVSNSVKRFGMTQFMMQALFGGISTHWSKQLGIPPGGEFRAAFEESEKLGSKIILVDRRIEITMQRALKVLSVQEFAKMCEELGNLTKGTIGGDDIEMTKQAYCTDIVEKSLTEKFPALYYVLGEERDAFLAKTIHMLSTPTHDGSGHALKPLSYPFYEGTRPPVVVAVVGVGRLPGIKNSWEAVMTMDLSYLNSNN